MTRRPPITRGRVGGGSNVSPPGHVSARAFGGAQISKIRVYRAATGEWEEHPIEYDDDSPGWFRRIWTRVWTFLTMEVF